MAGKCICKGCPSWKDCGEEIAYCFTGKSKCIKVEQWCICAACPVTKEMNLKHNYYCMKGSEKEQS